jgi:hypothetical protein
MNRLLFKKNQRMKTYVIFLLAAGLFVVTSCEYDSYPYYKPDGPHHNQQETFQLKGIVSDADSLWKLPSIQVLLIPSEVQDTFVSYTDTNGVFSFIYKLQYGDYAVLNFLDTSGVYEPHDTLLWFSGRDFNAGIREFFVHL